VQAPASITAPRFAFLLPAWRPRAPQIIAGLAFVVLFAVPLLTLPRDWLTQPDAGHGILLAPIAIYLAAKRGLRRTASAQPALGTALLVAGVGLRALGELAAEPFTMRLSLLIALMALVVYSRGVGQLLDWWATVLLLLLCIPLPSVLLSSVALPLQFQASAIGAALLEARYVPVRLAGNVIYLPGQTLFVTEACSGLRSLAALLSLGLLMGVLSLRSPLGRVLLIASAIPIAILLNGLRIFLTGFLVYYVSPEFGGGFMHLTEGWLVFLLAFGMLGATARVLRCAESFGKARAA
jgi:exosortase